LSIIIYRITIIIWVLCYRKGIKALEIRDWKIEAVPHFYIVKIVFYTVERG